MVNMEKTAERGGERERERGGERERERERERMLCVINQTIEQTTHQEKGQKDKKVL